MTFPLHPRFGFWGCRGVFLCEGVVARADFVSFPLSFLGFMLHRADFLAYTLFLYVGFSRRRWSALSRQGNPYQALRTPSRVSCFVSY